jgi:hypothetical protein
MTDPGHGSGETTVVRLEAALRDHFLGWQCRVRQLCVREAGGRPTEGMRPLVRLAPGGESLGRITALIVRKDPAESTARFNHIVRKTQDPAERYDDALKTLSAAYYQRPREFSDELTALFGAGSEIAQRLLATSACVLEFAQYQQTYHLPCAPRELAREDPAFQATLWHNAMFNPSIPGDARVLGLRPDWARAEADPPVR